MATLAPTISYLTNIYFGSGMVSNVSEILKQLGCQRPLIVTDQVLMDVGLVSKLGLSHAPAFTNVFSNPSETSALAGLEPYLSNDCDSIIALGGGSPIDCAKGIAVMVNHPPPLDDYAFVNGGLTKITDNLPPLIAIPTTAGTGSEVGRAALLTMDSGNKIALVSPHLIPKAAICDPELTLGLPAWLTAATGMDAISHCVETYCSPKLNPVAESIALDGLGRACRNLSAAVLQGSDITIRSEMMMAALQGGLTFQKGLGLIHSLSHPLGAVEKSPHHGTLNSIFLPPVLRYNMSTCPEKMDRMAEVVGIGSGDELPDFFAALSAEIGLPSRLSELGLTADDLAPMPELAIADHCTLTNPASATAADCKKLYEESN
ncbi:MAG: iron-containing alcohol dehydrogenase [Lentisphaeria bacterium]|nr:iron-containing alcohol dehydrogenase [Lentisphaeria bacterium]NQZ67604.1 iron-containing alcohol dehydrogenase [Lentisphaeria bacterium]